MAILADPEDVGLANAINIRKMLKSLDPAVHTINRSNTRFMEVDKSCEPIPTMLQQAEMGQRLFAIASVGPNTCMDGVDPTVVEEAAEDAGFVVKQGPLLASTKAVYIDGRGGTMLFVTRNADGTNGDAQKLVNKLQDTYRRFKVVQLDGYLHENLLNPGLRAPRDLLTDLTKAVKEAKAKSRATLAAKKVQFLLLLHARCMKHAFV